MFIKQTEHTHSHMYKNPADRPAVVMVMRSKGSWLPARVGRFLRPEARSAGYSAGVANKILTSMITSHYPRWRRITGYFSPHSISTCNDASTWIRPWILQLPGEVHANSCSSISPLCRSDDMISAVCLSAVCRMTRHNLDQLPPSQGGLGLLQFWMLLVLYGAMYSSAYQFTLAKVVPNTEHSGWSRQWCKACF